MAKPLVKLRLTRRLDAGIVKIKDRKMVEGKEETVYHILGAKHSPIRAMVPRKKKVKKKGSGENGKPVEYDRVDIPGDFISAKDEKGAPVWSKKGMGFEVHDADYVLKHFGGILEKV